MTKESFYTELSPDYLSEIAPKIPYAPKSGNTKEIDRKIPKLFACNTLAELEDEINKKLETLILKNSDNVDYYKHRWFMSKCSEASEQLFYNVTGLEQKYFNFILKNVTATDHPEFSGSMDLFKNPLFLVDGFYKREKTDFYIYPKKLKNNLFIMHFSFKSPADEHALRVNFKINESVFRSYVDYYRQTHKMFEYMNGRKSDIIYIIELSDGAVKYAFGTEVLGGEMVWKNV